MSNLYNVDAGVTSDNLILNEGDQLFVHSDGIANETFVNADAFAFISKGGTINDTYINQDGEVDLESSATANNTQINTGGYMIVYEKAKAIGTVVEGGSLAVSSGGTATDTTVNEPGYLYVFGGGKIAGSTTVNEGGNITLEWGIRSNVDVHGGKMVVKGDTETMDLSELKTFTVDSGGSLIVSASAFVSSGTIANASAKVLNGGTLEKVTLNAATVEVRNGALLSNADMKTGTVVDVQEGGAIRKLYVSKGAVLTGVLGEVSELQFDGGTLDLNIANMAPGGTVRVSDEAFTYISSRPYECTLTVASGQATGTYSLIEGATSFDKTVTVKSLLGDTLGTLAVDGTLVSGALSYTLGLDTTGLYVTVDAGGATPDITGDLSTSFNLTAGMVGSKVNILEGGKLKVLNGGFASQTTVKTGGSMTVSAGGSADIVTVNDGGTMFVYSGAKISNITDETNGQLIINEGVTVTGIVAVNGAKLTLSVAPDTYVQGTYDGNAFELKDAVLSGFTLKTSGYVNVFDGGVTSDVTVSGGLIRVYSGGVAKDTLVSAGGELMLRKEGAVANGVTIKDGCKLTFFEAGGKLTGKVTIETGAIISVCDGAIVDFDLTKTTTADPALVNDLSFFGTAAVNYTLTVDGTEADGDYKLAEGATGFDKTITVVNTSGTTLGTLTVGGGTTTIGGRDYTLTLTGGNLGLTLADGGGTPVDLTGDLDTTFELTAGMVGSSVNILDGGSLEVLNGGFASQTTVNSNGDFVVSGGGSADVVTVNFGDDLFVRNGGVATLVMENGGYASVNDGAIVTFVPNSFNGYVYDKTDDWATLHSGTTGTDLTVGNAARILVFSSGLAKNTTVNTGGALVVSTGGKADGMNLKGGTLFVSDGGRITGKITFETGATVTADAGAILDFDLTQTTAGADALVNDLSFFGTAAVNYTLTVDGTDAAGDYKLAEGAAGFDKTITVVNTSGTTLGTISVGTTATLGGREYTLTLTGGLLGLTLADGGGTPVDLTGDLNTYYDLGTGKYASAVNIQKNGELDVEKGALASQTTVQSGGYFYLYEGGVAKETIVNSGGRFYNYEGEADAVTVNYGGYLCVSSGKATQVTENGGCVVEYEGAVVEYVAHGITGLEVKDWNSATLHSGTTATDTTIGYGGYLMIYNGGSAGNTDVAAGGYLDVYAGGKATGASVASGGGLYVYAGGSATGIDVASGAYFELTVAPGTYVKGTYGGSAVETGNTVTNYTVHSGCAVDVASEGLATNTTVEEGGWVYVEDGGKAEGVTVASGGQIDIYVGGSATGIVAADGARLGLSIAPNTYAKGTLGGKAFEASDTLSDFTVHTGSWLEVFNGGSVDSITVDRGGSFWINDYGKATNVMENGGYVYVDTYADVKFVANTFTGIEVKGGKVATVHSGTTATDTKLSGYGNLDVYEGGLAINTTLNTNGYLNVSSGGLASATTVNNEGRLYAYEGGTASDTTIKELGELYVYEHGTAEDVTVEANGSLYVYNGGKLTGKATFETGASASFDDGAIVDFDLRKTTTLDPALVNDLSVVGTAAVNYTLTVDGTQASGTYNLADGATGFDKAITVVNTSGTTFGTLAVGGTLSTVFADYTLNLSGGALTLDLTAKAVTDTTPPVVSNVQLSTIEFTNQNVTVTADFTDNVAVKSKLYKIGDGAWQDYDPVTGVVMTENGTVYFKAVDTSDNESEVVPCNVPIIDKVPPTITITPSTTEPAASVTLSVVCEDETCMSSILQYRIGDGAWQDCTEPVTVTENTTVSFKTFDAAGNETVESYAVTNITTGGTVVTGDVADATKEINGGDIASGVTVNANGMLNVNAGGVASQTTVNAEGGLFVYDGGKASQTTVNAGGELFLYDGAKADGTTVTGGAVYVYGGGSATDTTLQDNGSIIVSNGGVAAGATAEADGWIRVSAGGVVEDVTVKNGGKLLVSAGGKATGRMSFETGAYINFYDGAILDFNIYSLSPGNEALVNDLSLISGTPKYTLTVNGAQAFGTYNLASGAMGFGETITVQSILGTEAGTLTVDGGATLIGDVYYTLVQTGSDLMVEVSSGEEADTTPPTITIYPSTTEPAASVTVSAVILDDVGVKTQQYRIGDGEWKNYTAPVTVTENAVISFQASDTSGNVTVESYTVTNITAGAADNKPDNGWNDYLYDKKKGWNTEENVSQFASNVITGNGEINLDVAGTIDFEGMHNMFGNDGTDVDTGDVGKVSVPIAAKVSFSVKSTADGTFYIYEDGLDKKGNRAQITVGKVTVKKGKVATLKDICLTADGKYYAAMTAKNVKKAGTQGVYNVTVVDSTVFVDADGGWNNAPLNKAVVENPVVIERGMKTVKLDNTAMIDGGDFNNFVGFTDAVDYAKLNLASTAYLSFDLGTNGFTKFTLWKRATNTGTISKVGGVTTLKSKNGELVAKSTKAQLLEVSDKYEYFISMESKNATKGGSAYYNVNVNTVATRFFDSADGGENNWLFNKKQKEFNDDANLRSNTISKSGDNVVILDNNPIGDTAFKNFVGYQDSADYAKIVLTKNGTLTFKITALANVSFEIWQKGTDKKGKNVLNSLQKKTSLTVKDYAVGASVTTNALTLDAGEYYISVTAKSTKANEKGSAFYNVTAMFSPSESVTDALAMPETDALAMTDSLSFASPDTDALAGASAFDKLASLDDDSSWQSIAKLA